MLTNVWCGTKCLSFDSNPMVLLIFKATDRINMVLPRDFVIYEDSQTLN